MSLSLSLASPPSHAGAQRLGLRHPYSFFVSLGAGSADNTKMLEIPDLPINRENFSFGSAPGCRKMDFAPESLQPTWDFPVWGQEQVT